MWIKWSSCEVAGFGQATEYGRAYLGNGARRFFDQVCIVRRRALAPGEHDVFEEQILNASAEERFNRLARRVDDGLPFDIETGVEHHFTSADFAHGFQERVELRVVLR